MRPLRFAGHTMLIIFEHEQTEKKYCILRLKCFTLCIFYPTDRERYMPMPTRERVLADLNKWKQNTDQGMAKTASTVYSRLELLTADSQDEAEKLAKDLYALLFQKTNDVKNINNQAFLDTLYEVLLVVGLECPINERDEESRQFVDVISQVPIPEKYMYVSSDRYQWNILKLMEWREFKSRMTREGTFVFLNPSTNVPFNDRDLSTMQKIAEEAHSPFTTSRHSTSYFSCCFFNCRQVEPIFTSEQIEEFQRNQARLNGPSQQTNFYPPFHVPGTEMNQLVFFM